MDYIVNPNRTLIWKHSNLNLNSMKDQIKLEIRNYIGKSQINQAIDLLLNDDEYCSIGTLIKSRFSRLESDSRVGILSFQDQNLQRNQIVQSILSTIGEESIKSAPIQVQITINMNPKEFGKQVSSLNLDELIPICNQVFRGTEAWKPYFKLRSAYDEIEGSGEVFQPGWIAKFKEDLIGMFTNFAEGTSEQKNKEIREDLDAAYELLKETPSKTSLEKAFVLLNLFYMNNPNFNGKEEAQAKRQKLSTSDMEDLLAIYPERYDREISRIYDWLKTEINSIIKQIEI